MLRGKVADQLESTFMLYIEAHNELEVSWNGFVSGIRDGSEWFDHLAMAAAADAFNLTINIRESTRRWTDPTLVCRAPNGPSGIVVLGHLGEFHYVALTLRPVQQRKRSKK